nr:TIGR03118 family protein [Sphingomonas oligoaromativorans]
MSKIRSSLGWLIAGASTLALAGCGGGNNSSGSSGGGVSTPPTQPAPTTPATSAYTVKALVSNVAGAAAQQDSNLQHGWGVSFAPNAAAWVAAHAGNVTTVYDGDGNTKLPAVAIPAGAKGTPSGPTGTVGNASSSFVIKKNGVSAAAQFLFDGTGGTISGWNESVDPSNTVTLFDGSTQGDAFTGLAIVTQGTTNMLIATDAAHGTVDAFVDNGDGTLKQSTLAGGFTDPNLPAGYKPFGVQTIGNQIYVSYAHFTGTNPLEDHGAGLGLVDIYDLTGKLVKRFVDVGGALNAPWGMAMAPASFGQFSGDLLIGDFGDGTINVYDPTSGKMLGQLSDSSGKPIVIPGLWGIAFGNDAAGFDQPSTTLFYAAGPTQTQGIYGRIDLGNSASTAQPAPTSPPANSGLGY